MLLKTMTTGLAAAALLAVAASTPTYVTGGGHGAAGNWPQEGAWNWPIMCKWVSVKVNVHKHPTWQWVKQCQ